VVRVSELERTWPGRSQRQPSRGEPGWAVRKPLAEWLRREGAAPGGTCGLGVGCGVGVGWLDCDGFSVGCVGCGVTLGCGVGVNCGWVGWGDTIGGVGSAPLRMAR